MMARIERIFPDRNFTYKQRGTEFFDSLCLFVSVVNSVFLTNEVKEIALVKLESREYHA